MTLSYHYFEGRYQAEGHDIRDFHEPGQTLGKTSEALVKEMSAKDVKWELRVYFLNGITMLIKYTQIFPAFFEVAEIRNDSITFNPVFGDHDGYGKMLLPRDELLDFIEYAQFLEGYEE